MYADSLIEITDSALIIKHYYFPLGSSKHILFSDIKKVRVLKNTVFNGKIRIWGGGVPAWLALDVKRPKREAIFRVLVKNSFIMAGFTAESSDGVVKQLIKSGIAVEIQ